MTQEEKTQIEERIVDVLKTVYDPEITNSHSAFFLHHEQIEHQPVG